MADNKPYECDHCRDSGTVARFVSTGNYKCAGPVPDNARGCYETYCDCPIGMGLRREERDYS